MNLHVEFLFPAAGVARGGAGAVSRLNDLAVPPPHCLEKGEGFNLQNLYGAVQSAVNDTRWIDSILGPQEITRGHGTSWGKSN